MAATTIFQGEKLYTADEFEQMPQVHERYELIEGRIIEKHTPFFEHGYIAIVFIDAYKEFDPKKKLGHMQTETTVKLNRLNRPVPDVSYWTAERRPTKKTKSAPEPDLAIEIWSEHDWETKKRMKDAREKCERYIGNGVKLVWAVNPKTKPLKFIVRAMVERLRSKFWA